MFFFPTKLFDLFWYIRKLSNQKVLNIGENQIYNINLYSCIIPHIWYVYFYLSKHQHLITNQQLYMTNDFSTLPNIHYWIQLCYILYNMGPEGLGIQNLNISKSNRGLLTCDLCQPPPHMMIQFNIYANSVYMNFVNCTVYDIVQEFQNCTKTINR